MWVRVPPSPMNDITEFQRESYRIDEQIWNALALRPDERAIFLGLANDGAWVARAVDIGVDVTVVASTDAQIAAAERAGASAMRGSATMIAATEGSYDVAVAMHYLHEIDPGFHGRVVSELARVARRVAIVEPSPPADPLGKRIAALYSRAKREGGQFEGYQTIDYWRKLLAIVKAEVWQNLFTFTKVPPRNAVAETVSLVLDAMAIEDLPQGYLDELRAIAARPDAQLLPLSRIVLVGTAAGVALGSGTVAPFRKDALPDAPVARLAPIAAAPPAARRTLCARRTAGRLASRTASARFAGPRLRARSRRADHAAGDPAAGRAGPASAGRRGAVRCAVRAARRTRRRHAVWRSR